MHNTLITFKGYTMMIRKKIVVTSVLATFALIGCGSGSSDSSTTGHLVDSAIANVDYDCIADNQYNKSTAQDGAFTCKNMSSVRFRLGELVLGEIHGLHEDKYVYPQDLVGVDRTSGLENERVIAMAQLVQALDTDGNPENGITIAKEQARLLVETRTEFQENQLDIYLESASVNPENVPTKAEAQIHLNQTMLHHAHEQETKDQTVEEHAVDNTNTHTQDAQDHATDAQNHVGVHATDAQDHSLDTPTPFS